MDRLVSCVMATKNRPGFFRIALGCFLRQTYQPRELIVVDDGEESVEPLCAGLQSVRYLRLAQATPLGTKLNLGASVAQGEVIQKLDDDDYYHHDFLRTALDHLPAGEDGCLVAWDCFLVLHTSDTALRQSGHGWRAGGTFCFPKSIWRKKGFRDLPKSVDSWFIRDHQPRVIPVCAPEQYVLVRHGRNTWTQMQGGLDADEFLRTRPIYSDRLEVIVDPAAAAFYRSQSQIGR